MGNPKKRVKVTEPLSASPKSMTAMVEWLKSNHPYAWSQGSLNNCWIMEVLDGSETICYAWIHHAATRDIIEFHACAAPGQEGRWLTPHVLDRLWQVGLETGAKYCIAQITSPLIARIWARVGATVHNRIAVLPLS